MKQDDVFCLYDGKGKPVHNIHVFTDEKGRVCVSYYDTRGNFEGTMRHEPIGEMYQVDLLDSSGTVVDSLACDVEVGGPGIYQSLASTRDEPAPAGRGRRAAVDHRA